MRDFLPADVRKREYVIGIIKEVYESYGFEPLETPSVENIETLMGKYGEEGNQLIFRILKRGEKLEEGAAVKDLADLALRYDLTVPLARVVAHHRNELPKFFKRYQIQPVWRADRPAKGRYREFYQCDVDAIGSDSMVVEAELITAVSEILERLGFKEFVVGLNNRKILTGLLDAAKVSPEKHSDFLVALDKLKKIGPDGVRNEVSERGIFSTPEGWAFYDTLIEAFLIGMRRMAEADSIVDGHLSTETIQQISNEVIENISQFIGNHEIGQQGIAELKQILKLVKGRIGFEPGLARGLSYYTGAIMEVNDPGFAGSLAGGGRYDGLIGMFGKEPIPACGISLGLERIIVVMEERGMFPPEIAAAVPADVMVTIWNEDSVAESLKLASELRTAGHRVLVYPEADKLGKQFKYAGQIGVPCVCVIGETELADGTVTVKNMVSGDQETVARDNVAAKINRK
jgi:histidyl-tRNA synthetase